MEKGKDWRLIIPYATYRVKGGRIGEDTPKFGVQKGVCGSKKATAHRGKGDNEVNLYLGGLSISGWGQKESSRKSRTRSPFYRGQRTFSTHSNGRVRGAAPGGGHSTSETGLLTSLLGQGERENTNGKVGKGKCLKGTIAGEGKISPRVRGQRGGGNPKNTKESGKIGKTAEERFHQRGGMVHQQVGAKNKDKKTGGKVVGGNGGAERM